MAPYTIDRGSNWRREAVERWLFGLDRVSPALRADIVTAWVSSWASISHATLEEMPFTPDAPDYPLMAHVNDLTRRGSTSPTAPRRMGRDGRSRDLLPILILHDLDKPLLYVRKGDGAGYSQLAEELPHGVVGAMMLKELGFAHSVVARSRRTPPTRPSMAEFRGLCPALRGPLRGRPCLHGLRQVLLLRRKS